MPTFDTPNSSTSYQVPSDVTEIGLINRGGVGGDGGDGDVGNGGSGGDGGELRGVLAVSGGETYTVYVGEDGENGSLTSAGAGGSVPYNGGQSGGSGGGGASANDAAGGGGGAQSAFERDADGALIGAGEGGGAGGGGSSNTQEAGGGGGGARGGAGGSGPIDAGDGESGDGSGNGGDGGQGFQNGSDGQAGQPGGTAAHGDLAVASTGSSTAGPSIEIVESPAAPSNLSASASGTQADLSWTDNASDEDGIFVYRAGSSGSTVGDYTQIADLSADTTSYTDTGLSEGKQYHYRVTAYKSGVPEVESAVSNEADATTDLPAPSGLSATDGPSPAMETDLSWTDNAADETGFEAQFSIDGGASWTVATAALGADTTSYTHTGERNGEEYTWRVRSLGEDANSPWSGTATHTTTLPDATGLSLDNSVEDEITAEVTDTTNYGDVRFQIRETGESSWSGSATGFAEQTLASDSDTSGTLSTVFGGLEDGEEYEVRARTETEHVTGAWTTPTAKITVFPAPDNLQVTDRFDTVALTYDDNADNEASVELQRSTDGGSTWTTVDTYSPNTTSVEDANPILYQAVDYRVRQSTNDASATTSVVTTTAARADDGIWAEILKPDTLLGDDVLQGAIAPDDVAAVDRIDLEHTAISGWSISLSPATTAIRDYHLGDLAIYYGDVQLIRGPIQRTPRRAQTISVEGEGPSHALRTDTTRESYSNERVDEAIENYQTNISVADSWTVIEPAVTQLRTDDPLINTNFGDTFDALFDSVAADEPIVFDEAADDSVSLAQCLWMQEAEDAPSIVGGTVINDSDMSGGDGLALDNDGQWFSFEFTPGHDIPSEDVGWAWRTVHNNWTGDIVLSIGGTEVFRRTATESGDSLDWLWDINTTDPPDLQAGTTYTVRIDGEANSNNTDWISSIEFDLVCVYDQLDRYGGFSPTFDNQVDSFEALDGPELHPPTHTIRNEQPAEVFHVNEMTATSTWDDTSNQQAIRLSTTGQSSDFVGATNTDSQTADFDAADVYGSTPVVELTLSRYSSGDGETPLQGDEGQTVSELVVTADIDDLPIIGSDGISLDAASWLENMQALHERGQYRFTPDYSAEGLEVTSYRTGGDNAVQTDDWTTRGIDAVSRERDSGDYYNEVRVFAAEDSGISPLVSRYPDQSEQDRVGVIERRAVMSGAQTVDERKEAAREALLEGIAGDRENGSIEIVPTVVAPGYPYEPSEFGGSRSNLERVRISQDADSVSGTLQFGARRDIVATIQQRTS